MRMPRTAFDRFFSDQLSDSIGPGRGLGSLLDAMLLPQGAGLGSAFVPAVNLFESDGSYVVEAAAPGWSKDDISIEVSENRLTLSGKASEEKERGDKRYHLREMRRTSFTRSVEFPYEIDAERVSAAFKDGVLTITVPTVAQSQPKKIDIKT